MASQHPDHAMAPYWGTSALINTKEEILECYLAFSELGVEEYMWDWEGKLVDESVMERLLSEHYDYFINKPIGSETFLTFRLPNPSVESETRLGRAFMGILGATTMARHIGLTNPPLFEVILPMTTAANDILAIQVAFREIASLKHPLFRLEISGIKHIEVIPLFEDVDTIVNSNEILFSYLKLHKEFFGSYPPYLRPFIARSDPALNAGQAPTVLAIKIALSKYKELEKKTGVLMYPILGCASLPFRGGLHPYSLDDFLQEYKGIDTAVIQSAFRYDYEKKDVKKAIKKLNKHLGTTEPQQIQEKEEKELQQLITLFQKFYTKTIESIADEINTVAASIPKRRERVQHVGLFGYSRGIGKVKLPRAIGFTAAMYSLGCPPELVGTGRGLAQLTSEQKELLRSVYQNIKLDLLQAGRYVNKEVVTERAKMSKAWQDIQKDIEGIEAFLGEPLGPVTLEEKEHNLIVQRIAKHMKEKKPIDTLIEQAGVLRRSLG